MGTRTMWSGMATLVCLLVVGLALLLGCLPEEPPRTDGGADGDTDTDTRRGDCPIGEIICDRLCVHPDSDPNHCGDCEVTCADTEDCRDGECVPGS